MQSNLCKFIKAGTTELTTVDRSPLTFTHCTTEVLCYVKDRKNSLK